MWSVELAQQGGSFLSHVWALTHGIYSLSGQPGPARGFSLLKRIFLKMLHHGSSV